MTDRLAAIRKLLSHPRPDRRRAAAIVLAEVGASDGRTVAALRTTLGDQEPDVRLSAVEALGQLGASDAVDDLIGLLTDRDEATRSAAEAALLKLGDHALPSLQRLLAGTSAARRSAAAMLSRLESSAGLGMLVESVDGSDPAVVDRARRALREKGSALDLAELRELRRGLEQRLTDARRGGEDAAAVAFLQLLADLPDETVVTRIVKETGADVPAPVRRAALSALATVLPLARGRRREAAIEQLLDCLGEGDEDGVVRPALRALQDVALPKAFAAKAEALLEAPSAAARAFALRQLGRHGARESISALVAELVAGPATVREAAREALSELPEAAPALAAALREAEDPERLAELGELLRSHRKALPAAEIDALCAWVLDAAEARQDEARPLVEATANALAEVFMEALRDRVAQRRKRKRLAEAVGLLNAAASVLGEEDRYLLGVLSLEQNAKGAQRPLRATDRVCQHFGFLLAAGFPVEARLLEEPTVDAGDLYQLGFAFSESRDRDARDFGHDLLEVVADRSPESKLGLAARNKLRLLGR